MRRSQGVERPPPCSNAPSRAPCPPASLERAALIRVSCGAPPEGNIPPAFPSFNPVHAPQARRRRAVPAHCAEARPAGARSRGPRTARPGWAQARTHHHLAQASAWDRPCRTGSFRSTPPLRSPHAPPWLGPKTGLPSRARARASTPPASTSTLFALQPSRPSFPPHWCGTCPAHEAVLPLDPHHEGAPKLVFPSAPGLDLARRL